MEFIDKKRDVNIIITYNDYNEKNVFDIKRKIKENKIKNIIRRELLLIKKNIKKEK